MISLSITISLAIVVAIIALMHQSFNIIGCTKSLLMRMALASVGFAFLFKVLERAHGDAPTILDITRDAGVLGLLVIMLTVRIERLS